MNLDELIESFKTQAIYVKEQREIQRKKYYEDYGLEPPIFSPFDAFCIIEALLLICEEIKSLKDRIDFEDTR